MMKLKSLREADDGWFMIVAVIIMMILSIFIILTITANIVPIVIFLVLAIIFVLIVKHILFGGRSFGIIHGAGGAARYAGREGVGLIKAAHREYGHYRK